MSTAHLAIDLGASSGRAIVGILEGDPKNVRLEEVHRFQHLPCPTPGGPVWDLTGLWLNILEGLKNAHQWCEQNDFRLTSIGVDTWGVDWTLIGSSGELLGLPHCYRDPQNEAACERVLDKIGGEEALYQRNGIQIMALNSVFQVAARLENEPNLFQVAERLLFMPDLFHFLLSGEMTTERTIASTSAMLALESGDWDWELMDELGVPKKLLGPLIEPGSDVGTLRKEVAESTGANQNLRVIAPPGHDTAAAIAAVPATDPDQKWAYLSSGTWSLLGLELDQAFTSSAACAAPFTNERGVGGTVRFLKNIAGLWLVQELRRQQMEKGEAISFSEMVEQARAADPFRTLINPNESRFSSPGNMAGKIRDFAAETNQPEPETMGDLVRCCLESLALCYRDTVDQLESVLSTKIDVLHIVGGGTQNEFLSELTVAAMQRPVICGPVEATAVGNVLVQAMGCGELRDLQEIRQVLSRSFELTRYDYDEAEAIPDEVFERFQKLVKK